MYSGAREVIGHCADFRDSHCTQGFHPPCDVERAEAWLQSRYNLAFPLIVVSQSRADMSIRACSKSESVNWLSRSTVMASWIFRLRNLSSDFAIASSNFAPSRIESYASAKLTSAPTHLLLTVTGVLFIFSPKLPSALTRSLCKHARHEPKAREATDSPDRRKSL